MELYWVAVWLIPDLSLDALVGSYCQCVEESEERQAAYAGPELRNLDRRIGKVGVDIDMDVEDIHQTFLDKNIQGRWAKELGKCWNHCSWSLHTCWNLYRV